MGQPRVLGYNNLGYTLQCLSMAIVSQAGGRQYWRSTLARAGDGAGAGAIWKAIVGVIVGNLLKRLADYAHDTSKSYAAIHEEKLNELAQGALERFLAATMDEVRLRNAQTYAQTVMGLHDLDLASHFSTGLFRREYSGAIAYQRQRDHMAHGLYNYLFGFFLVDHSEVLMAYIEDKIARRLPSVSAASFESKMENFAEMWCLASLLHDIGYIFEGVLDPFDPRSRSDQAMISAEVTHDYFHHRFWTGTGIGDVAKRREISAKALAPAPEIAGTSLSDIATGLRLLGDMRHLNTEFTRGAAPQGTLGDLPGDGIALWRLHYEYYAADAVVSLVDRMERFFERLLYKGTRDGAIRMLDHGVCGGLLQLRFVSHWFRLRFGVEHSDEIPADKKRSIIEALGRDPLARRGLWNYTAEAWWSKLVWATGATALHNYLQAYDDWDRGEEPEELLSVEVEPLAYLGILVDCLQQWDRYSVRGTPAITGRLPIQGADMSVNILPDGRTRLLYEGESSEFLVAEIAKTLDSCLEDWGQIVVVEALR